MKNCLECELLALYIDIIDSVGIVILELKKSWANSP
jgi:hypothetical protein